MQMIHQFTSWKPRYQIYLLAPPISCSYLSPGTDLAWLRDVLPWAVPSGNYSNQYGIQLGSIARSQFVCQPETYLRLRV
ncbi:hypothetical protein K501DRAFT_287105, partial [Backusella circina FSU 941]